MALVLNAVAGARRSQRNNARSADVNAIAAGVNQFIATRNALPLNWTAISGIVDETKFGHYEVSSINQANSIDAANTITPQAFPDYQALATVANGQVNSTEASAADRIVVMRETGCDGTTDIEQGGIREMAILYRLEGQTDISCLEI